MVSARQIVSPPSYTPSPYGLLTAADPGNPTDQHWQSGVIYQPFCSDPSSTYDECLAITGIGGNPPPPAAFDSSVSGLARAATAFTVYQRFVCSAVGNAEAQRVASAALSQTEGWQVERSFWSGVSGGQPVVFPHLAADADIYDIDSENNVLLQSAAEIVTGVGDLTNPATVLGLIESELADCYAGVGVIHIPVVAIPTFDAWGLLKVQGSRLYTLNGNKVAAGNGYPGTGPDGSDRDADLCWIYGTGNVFVYKTDMRVRTDFAQAFDKTTNTLAMIAERTYLVGWDCCHYAAQVALGTPKGT